MKTEERFLFDERHKQNREIANLQLLLDERFFVAKQGPPHHTRKHRCGKVLPGESTFHILRLIDDLILGNRIEKRVIEGGEIDRLKQRLKEERDTPVPLSQTITFRLSMPSRCGFVADGSGCHFSKSDLVGLRWRELEVKESTEEKYYTNTDHP